MVMMVVFWSGPHSYALILCQHCVRESLPVMAASRWHDTLTRPVRLHERAALVYETPRRRVGDSLAAGRRCTGLAGCFVVEHGCLADRAASLCGICRRTSRVKTC